MKKLLLGIVTAMFTSCGSSTEVAGATGVGNPSGTVTTAISICADNGVIIDSSDLTETNKPVLRHSKLDKSYSKVKTHDSSGLSYDVTCLEMSIDSIAWELSSEPSVPIDNRLHRRGNELILSDGPWTFDLISRTMTNSKELLVNLPEMSFKNIRFYINSTASTNAITIGGTISQTETLSQRGKLPQYFAIALPFPMELNYPNPNAVRIGGTTGNLSLIFNPENWLSSVNPSNFGHIKNDTLTVKPKKDNTDKHYNEIKEGISQSSILRYKK